MAAGILDDLDNSIYTLLREELNNLSLTAVEISLEAPNQGFSSSVSANTVNLFLYDIRENLELRHAEMNRPLVPTQGLSSATFKGQGVKVAYSYLITAWSIAETYRTADEHHLLNTVISILLRYPSLPNTCLQGDLFDAEPRPRCFTLQPPMVGSTGEFWSAMGGEPKPMVNYSVTVTRFPRPDHEEVLVTETQTTLTDTNLPPAYEQSSESPQAEPGPKDKSKAGKKPRRPRGGRKKKTT